MGAEFMYEELEAKTDKSAIAEVRIIRQQCLYDYGHAGYTGTFAENDGEVLLEINEPIDRDEAREWLMENCKKWGPVIIIKTQKDQYVAGAWCSS
jgi:hypothetical protein